MAKVHVEPEALRRFARDLTSFNQEIRQMSSRLQGRLSELEQTWRDQEHEKFVEAFRETSKVLDRFIQTSEEHVQVLGRKAAHIDQYLQQR